MANGNDRRLQSEATGESGGNRPQGKGEEIPGKKRRLTIEGQLEIVRRVENGEAQSDIARELGYSRQRISAIMIKYKEGGAEAFVHKKRGPKSGKMPAEEMQKLVAMLRDQSPAGYGFKKGEAWTFEKAEFASVQVLGRKSPKRALRAAFKEAGVELAFDSDPDADIRTPEFEAYLKSAKAKEIREREAAYHERLEKEGLKFPKRGRPSKEESAMRSAQPWNPDVREEFLEAKTKTETDRAGGDEATGSEAEARTSDDPGGATGNPEIDADEFDVPDWSNLTPEQFKELQKKYKMGPYLSGNEREPGVRTGKHRKAKAASRKKRKGGKKRR